MLIFEVYFTFSTAGTGYKELEQQIVGKYLSCRTFQKRLATFSIYRETNGEINAQFSKTSFWEYIHAAGNR